MHKKTGFFLGLLAGGVTAYFALKRMSPLKRQRLINRLGDKADLLKKNAVNYAFYADDTSKKIRKRVKSVANSVGDRAKYLGGHNGHLSVNSGRNSRYPHFRNAASHLQAALGNSHSHDIILNPDQALGSHAEIDVYYPDGTVRRN